MDQKHSGSTGSGNCQGHLFFAVAQQFQGRIRDPMKVAILLLAVSSGWATPTVTEKTLTSSCTLGSQTVSGSGGCSLSTPGGYAEMTGRLTSVGGMNGEEFPFSSFSANVQAEVDGYLGVFSGQAGNASASGTATVSTTYTLIADEYREQGEWGWVSSDKGQLHGQRYYDSDGTFGGNSKGWLSFNSEPICPAYTCETLFDIPFTVGVPFTLTLHLSTTMAGRVESDGDLAYGAFNNVGIGGHSGRI
jgi:hypothetical protein